MKFANIGGVGLVMESMAMGQSHAQQQPVSLGLTVPTSFPRETACEIVANLTLYRERECGTLTLTQKRSLKTLSKRYDITPTNRDPFYKDAVRRIAKDELFQDKATWCRSIETRFD